MKTIRLVLGLVICLAIAATGDAQESKPKKKQSKAAAAQTLPSGPVPTFMLVVRVNTDARELTLHYRVGIPVTELREVEVEIDGMKVKETRPFTVMREEERMLVLPFDQIVASAGGKTVEGDEAWKALRGQIVLVTQADKLDPAYAKLLSKDTVTIESKSGKTEP